MEKGKVTKKATSPLRSILPDCEPPKELVKNYKKKNNLKRKIQKRFSLLKLFNIIIQAVHRAKLVRTLISRVKLSRHSSVG